MPVASLFKFLLDDISNQKDFTSTKKIGDDEGCERRNKYHGNSADDSRNGQWQYDFKEGLTVVCAEISCGIDYIFVNLYEHVVDRKYHKWQKVIDHTKNDRIRCVDDRKLRQVEKRQNTVDHTILF